MANSPVVVFVVAVALVGSALHVQVLASSADASGRNDTVTFFSVVKLQHVGSQVRLHSSQMTYGTGSGQQAITGYPRGGDPNSYWLVKGAHNSVVPRQGEPVECGATVRLQHVETSANLHAHNHRSPLSSNIEVSGYGQGDEWGDEYDNFVVECATRAKNWMRDEKVALRHPLMRGYLSTSAAIKFPRTIRDHQEVCLTASKTSNSYWKTNEGVYFMDVASW